MNMFLPYYVCILRDCNKKKPDLRFSWISTQQQHKQYKSFWGETLSQKIEKKLQYNWSRYVFFSTPTLLHSGLLKIKIVQEIMCVQCTCKINVFRNFFFTPQAGLFFIRPQNDLYCLCCWSMKNIGPFFFVTVSENA